MDNPVFLADISWLRPEEGGRKSPIPMNQKQYAPVVAVDGQLKVSGSAWSLLCYEDYSEEFKYVPSSSEEIDEYLEHASKVLLELIRNGTVKF